MKEAIGGVMSLQIIMIVLIVMNCYLAFSVNYTKAFRTKNEIRSIIEKNEGFTCSAADQINEYMLETNYNISDGYLSWCESNGYEVARLGNGSFCYKNNKVDITGTTDQNTTYKGSYYTVVTFVNLDLPLINKVLPFAGNIFAVKGETALIYSSGNNSEFSDGCNL